ncbi:hypothetical protein AYO21_11375 [Fonsecaea monophora]|uniref:Uncharacterized protein n=1 Tax=Fonsecaea monophora TaxID=254056 RepID=A0A177ES41_9EURO|nr:hypothetical protein AYO21_11375 [Fonsecaea monophora]KAH0830825.1 hypothetical protein FOPE_02154 [Fonsecaea pedrosoi]OAG34466.1 hypothetical protein AYO21_11375 [Fonsecaea monophora]
MDDRILLPTDKVTALLKQDHFPVADDEEDDESENGQLREMVQQLSNPDSVLARRVEEISIGSPAMREYDYRRQFDEEEDDDEDDDEDGDDDHNHDHDEENDDNSNNDEIIAILPNVLDSAALERILNSVKNLRTLS